MTASDSARASSLHAPLAEEATIERLPEDGAALCLSGGGYRAMLFHLGTIWRLNDGGQLRSLRRISSVSGGSITAAWLGSRWRHLDWDDRGAATNFIEEVVDPIRRVASTTIDVRAVLGGLIPLRGPIGNRIARRYDRLLFRGATLQYLPDDSVPRGEADYGPRFVINATNLQSGVLWRFSRPYMADYTVGLVREPTIKLALAVAASAAFPPVLSPVVLKLRPEDFIKEDPPPRNARGRQRIELTDGGVYDNMGLETAWKRYRTVYVSDAGGGGGWWAPRPAAHWLSQFWRVFWIQRYQVGRLRRRQLIASYLDDPGAATHRFGAYWSIGSDIRNYGVDEPFEAPIDRTRTLRDLPTRLKRLDNATQERLINWGYAVSDAAIRRHVAPAQPRPASLPCEHRPI